MDTSTALAELKTKYHELGSRTQSRLGHLNTQVSRSKETIAELNQQITNLTAEKERLASQAPAGESSENITLLEQLKATVDRLTLEKIEADKALAEQVQKSDYLIAENKSALVGNFMFIKA